MAVHNLRWTVDLTPQLTHLPFSPTGGAPYRIPAKSGELHPAKALHLSSYARKAIPIGPITCHWMFGLGFGLCLIRAVMNGRGDEVIDLAPTNLIRC